MWHAVRVQSITVDCSSDDFLLEEFDEFISKSPSCRLGKYEHSLRDFLQGVFGRDASSLRNMKIKTAPIQFPNACSWFLLLIHYWTVQTSTEHYGSGTHISHSLPLMPRRKNWDVKEISFVIVLSSSQKWCWNWPAALHYQVAALGEHYTRLSRHLKTRISIRRAGRVRKWQFTWTSHDVLFKRTKGLYK